MVHSSPESDSARISKMNFEGEVVWQLDWPERLTFADILTGDGVYIAFGQKTVRERDSELPMTSVAIAFDERGEILWRHDSASSEEFTGAVWTDRGSAVLVGSIYSDTLEPEPGEGWSKGFIAEYDESGQVWRTAYPYQRMQYDGEKLPTDGRMTAVVSIQGGYLASAKVRHDGNMVRILSFDERGVLKGVFHELIGDISNADQIRLFQAKSNVYLIVSGQIDPQTPEQEENRSLISTRILIKEITRLPVDFEKELPSVPMSATALWEIRSCASAPFIQLIRSQPIGRRCQSSTHEP